MCLCCHHPQRKEDILNTVRGCHGEKKCTEDFLSGCIVWSVVNFSLWIKTFNFHTGVRQVNKDVKVVNLLSGSNSTGELHTSLLAKGSRRNNWKTVFSRHWSDKEVWFGSIWSGHQTAQFLEHQQNLLITQSLLFCAPFYWIMVSQISCAKWRSC